MGDEELMEKPRATSHYEVLGLATRTPTTTELKLAYKQKALQYHPDRNPENPRDAEAKFKLISEAHAVLSDPIKKQKYDAAMKERVLQHLKVCPGCATCKRVRERIQESRKKREREDNQFLAEYSRRP